MNPTTFYVLSSALLLLNGATLVLAFRLRRRLLDLDSEYAVLHQAIEKDGNATRAEILRLSQDVLQETVRILQKMSEPEPAHPLTGLAFLPTEAGAAEIERMILATEDRAISAGSAPSSSAPTRPSRNPFGRVRSIRGPRNSGAR